ncbi:ribosome silencing factor [Collinsella sp. An2]|nr:ribosome silencing factor [Collinsella sp. An2]
MDEVTSIDESSVSEDIQATPAGAEDTVEDLEEERARSFGSSVDRTAASLSSSGVSAEQVARTAAQAAYDKKGEDIRVLDLTQLSDVCDYFVIVTGINNRLADTIVDEVEEKVAKACGEHPFSIEGRDERAWILMDYGSVIVHVFTPEQREYYRLEKLWGDAPELELDLV